MGSWLLYLGVVAAVVTAATGFLASDQIGHDSPGHDAVHVHRNWMLVGSGLAVVAAVAAFATRSTRTAARRWSLFGLMLVTSVVVTLGADRGAMLVFGHGVGVRQEAVHAHEESGHAEEAAGHDQPSDEHEGHSH